VPFKLDEVAFFGLEIAKGMKFLNENQVIHRDLKSANVFVSFNDKQQGIVQTSFYSYKTNIEAV